jgi:FkbM family methyltransferase
VPSYDEVIISNGVMVPFVPEIISPKIERPLRQNRYEARECAAVRRMLQPGDRILELGAGVGLLSTVAGQVRGINSVTTVEANPGLIPLIRETHRVNGVGNITLINGVASAEDGPEIDFYLRPDFWASSMEPHSRPYHSVAKLPRIGVRNLVEELRPTVIICDIEGGELDLFDAIDLSSVRALVIELHPKVYGKAGLERIGRTLKAQGLAVPEDTPTGSVRILHREARVETLPLPGTVQRTVLVAEAGADAPWLLEWVAWHKAAGVDDIVVFSRGEDAATTGLLDRLDTMGIVRHLPHPGLAGGGDPLDYARHLPALRKADFAMVLGLDCFLNIRTGDQTLPALFTAAGTFDVLSAAEVLHGVNGHERFTPGWLTESHPRHQKTTPGKPKAMRLARSIVRLSAGVDRLGPHRPAFGEARPAWLDGSGRPLSALMQDGLADQVDCRGASQLVRIERFPLRDLDSYLASIAHTAGTTAGRRTFKSNWQDWNRAEEATAELSAMGTKARNWHMGHLESDGELMARHAAARQAHANRLASMSLDPAFARRRAWVLSEAW